jgi:hypothetical protein
MWDASWMKAKETHLSIKISGKGITPKTVDSVLLLRLAEACMRLTEKVAEASRVGLSFRGLAVTKGSAAVAMTPSDLRTARVVAGRAMRIVRGDEETPQGADGVVDDVRAQLRALPRGQSASFLVGKWAAPLTAPALDRADDAPWERTELRVRPVRVGGSGQTATATLTSGSELAPFRADLSREHARQLGALLWEDVDVELEMCRSADGRIEHARVTDVHVLGAGDPATTWRTWFAANAPEWEGVDNVLEALERGDRH